MSDSRTVPDSPDLAQLVNDGYSLEINTGHVLVHDLPFLTAEGVVENGTLMCPLDRAQNGAPATHVMWFYGGTPHDRLGQPLAGLNGNVSSIEVGGLRSTCAFSLNPAKGYANFHEKVTLYADVIVGPAQAVEPGATACVFKPMVTDEDGNVFRYLDTFSSRARIPHLNARLAVGKVVIVGGGGTGSYLLDLLAKTPVRQLHVYDGDKFLTHNAFRSPGAAGVEDLWPHKYKVDYLFSIYDRMRRSIHPHNARVTRDNVAEILDADFVFLAVDPSPDKRDIVQALIARDVPFIDTGIGVKATDDGISGLIRVTSSAPGNSGHVETAGVMSDLGDEEDDYNTNIQVSELNMLAAALAVIQFKQQLGFYHDEEREMHSLYALGDNSLSHRFGRTDTRSTGCEATDGGATEPGASAS
jgi:hypothetical protein